jgi:hypothetical protein
MPLVMLAGPALHLTIIWYNFMAASAAGGDPFRENNGLWQSALTLVGNPTLVVSKRVHMQQSPISQKRISSQPVFD